MAEGRGSLPSPTGEGLCPLCQTAVASPDDLQLHLSTSCTHGYDKADIPDRKCTTEDITVVEDPLTAKTLSIELAPVTKWYKLGECLGLKPMKLRLIESRNPGPQQCKLDVIDTWLQIHPNPSWRHVVAALYLMREDAVAEKIKQNHIHVSGPTEVERYVNTNINIMRGRFKELLQFVSKTLVEKKVSNEQFKDAFQQFLAGLPSCIKDFMPQPSEFLQTLSENPLVSFWNYFLLEEVIKVFGDNDPELESKMELYKKARLEFLSENHIKYFTKSHVYESEYHQPLNHQVFAQLSLMLDECVSDYSLNYIDELHENLSSYLSLPPYVLLFHTVTNEGVCIVWHIPKPIAHKVAEELQNTDFYQERKILKVSIDDECVYEEHPTSGRSQIVKKVVQPVPRKIGYDCEILKQPIVPQQTNCPICQLVLREPYLTNCCHSNCCYACIIDKSERSCPVCCNTNFTVTPNKGLQDLLKYVRVQCINCRSGCQWTGTLDHYEQHLNINPLREHHLQGCDFVEIECTYGCGDRFPRYLLDKHEKECSERTYTCEYCHEYTSVDIMDIVSIHSDECKCFPVPCRQNCGQQSIERQNLNHHIDNECPLTVISCSIAGCDVQLPRKNMPGHLADHKDRPECYLLEQQEEECSQRTYTCEYCHEYTSVDMMDIVSIHWDECKCFPVPCRQNCGQQSIERQNLNHHIDNECPLTVISCSIAGCDVQLPRKDMPGHLTDILAHKDQPVPPELNPIPECAGHDVLASSHTQPTLETGIHEANEKHPILRLLIPHNHYDSGYDCDIMENVPDSIQTECPICLLVLREPQRLDCCNKNFCKLCIGARDAEERRCPMCNRFEFSIIPNKDLEKELLDYDVVCSYEQRGCEWVGKLRDLYEHLNLSSEQGDVLKGCGFVEFVCIHCRECLQRRNILVDQLFSCPEQLSLHEGQEVEDLDDEDELHSKKLTVPEVLDVADVLELAEFTPEIFESHESVRKAATELIGSLAVKCKAEKRVEKYTSSQMITLRNETVGKSSSSHYLLRYIATTHESSKLVKDALVSVLDAVEKSPTFIYTSVSPLLPTCEVPGVHFHSVPKVYEVCKSEKMQTITCSGLKVHIPKVEVEKCHISLATCTSGSFMLPPGTELMSSVYYIENAVELQQPVTIDVEHCCDLDSESGNALTFAVADVSKGEPPYIFNTELQGRVTFPPCSPSGQLTGYTFPHRLSCFAILGNQGDRGHNTRYFARVYCQSEGRVAWKVTVVVAKKLEACIKAVEEHYCHFKELTNFDLHLDDESDSIYFGQLESSGEMTADGCWKVCPVFSPRITRSDIDNFPARASSPAKCELNIRCLKEGESPKSLQYTVHLQGTLEPKYFNIVLNSFHQDQLATTMSFATEIDQLGTQVQCHHKKEGCEWMGEPGELIKHLNENPMGQQLIGCEFVQIKCKECNKSFQRQHFKDHQLKVHLFSCEYCQNYHSYYEDVINNHWPICKFHPVPCPNKCGENPERQNLEHHVSKECPLTVVNCYFHFAGCEEQLPRRNMHLHLMNNLVTHMAQMATCNQETAQRNNQQITELVSKNEALSRSIAQLRDNAHKIVTLEQENGSLKQETVQLSEELEENRQKFIQLERQNEVLSSHFLDTGDETAQIGRSINIKGKPLYQPPVLPGVNFSDSIEVTVSGSKATQVINWEEHGIKIHIPPCSVSEGENKIIVASCLSGNFNLPPDTTLISAVYCISTSIDFCSPVILELEHCCTIPASGSTCGLVFASADISTKMPPYEFSIVRGGEFPPTSQNGLISMSTFSLTATFLEKVWGCSQPYKCRYRGFVFCQAWGEQTWKVTFVIIKDLSAHIQALKKLYYPLRETTDFKVSFSEESPSIILDGLEPNGITTDNECWEIRPFAEPVIQKDAVDEFGTKHDRPAKCEVSVSWLKDDQEPKTLRHTVHLKGNEHSSYFMFIVDPNTQEPRRSNSWKLSLYICFALVLLLLGNFSLFAMFRIVDGISPVQWVWTQNPTIPTDVCRDPFRCEDSSRLTTMQQCSKITDSDAERELNHLLSTIQGDWQIFAGNLGLKISQIESIQNDASKSTTEDKRRAALNKWVRSSEQTCIQDVVRALKTMEEQRLAHQVAEHWHIDISTIQPK